LNGLFEKNPEKRLGGGQGGAEEVKSHPWFKNLDWSLIYNKRIIPPFTPNLDSDEDYKYFDPEFTS